MYYRLYCMVVNLGLTAGERGAEVRMFENKVLTKIFGLRVAKFQENGVSYIMLSYMHCNLRLT